MVTVFCFWVFRDDTNFDDRFKLLLDPESAPSIISTLLPVLLTPFCSACFLADFVLDRKNPARSSRGLSVLLMDGIRRFLHKFMYNSEPGPPLLQYVKGRLLRRNPWEVLST